jgi:bifunctional non-homologous end joining protein LigD
VSLEDYRRKRDFHKTPEPSGKKGTRGGHSFVIQKHHASHLHYDFRLELDGVLKSWAVPKGPHLDPTVKRLAMHVEDHPVAYGSFEGIIPQGEYGGGTVMLWDRGTWEPKGDAADDYREGRLKFVLHGEKLNGAWMLVRTGGGKRTNGDERQWLLFKERDDWAKEGTAGDIVASAPLSVVSGRDLEQIAADRDWVWGGKAKATPVAKTGRRKSAPQKAKPAPAATRVSRPPTKARAAAETIPYDVATKTFLDVRLTSPEKVLYPEDEITKLELASYYSSVAEWILPHMADRPLVLVRCPDGRAKACFFQKHPAVGTPEAFRQIPIRENNKTANYILVDDVAGLISLAQIGALEVHAWGSRADKLEAPDRLIFDLDPDTELPWRKVIDGAAMVRQFLLDLGLESFVKTTGGKGLHLVVPIERRHSWPEAKAFCKRVAELIVAAAPIHFTANMSKAARPGKIYVDYLRNARGATAVLPYSPRARPGAPVSVPLAWQELNAKMSSDHFTIRNLAARLRALKSDPWEGQKDVRQSLTRPLAKLRTLPTT